MFKLKFKGDPNANQTFPYTPKPTAAGEVITISDSALEALSCNFGIKDEASYLAAFGNWFEPMPEEAINTTAPEIAAPTTERKKKRSIPEPGGEA
jgi:hypothetical protein